MSEQRSVYGNKIEGSVSAIEVDLSGEDEFATLRAQLAAAEEERADLNATFDLRHAADVRAIERWRQDHPEQAVILPDHADLCAWLLEQLTATEKDRDVWHLAHDLIIHTDVEAQRAKALEDKLAAAEQMFTDLPWEYGGRTFEERCQITLATVKRMVSDLAAAEQRIQSLEQDKGAANLHWAEWQKAAEAAEQRAETAERRYTEADQQVSRLYRKQDALRTVVGELVTALERAAGPSTFRDEDGVEHRRADYQAVSALLAKGREVSG